MKIQAEVEKHTISRYLDMLKQIERLEADLERARKDAAKHAYLAALQFPDFIDHTCETAKSGLVTPKGIISDILLERFGESIPVWEWDKYERRKDENSRHWLERLEAMVLEQK